MLLRERQRQFVDRCVGALREKRNTIGVAPTGAGKTVMLAAVAQEANARSGKPGLILQHRDELVTQNAKTFVRYMGARECQPKVINAEHKAWDRRGEGWNFAMVQTLVRNLDSMPALGFLGIDEAHHAAANSYIQIVERARQLNPNLILYGTTATPNRGDKKSLLGIFDNCADQIGIMELIGEGHLVRPRTFVVDIGVQDELRGVKRKAQDFDMTEVEAIMNKSVLNDEVVKHWQEKAGARQTIVFCSTVEHARDVCEAFRLAGVKAETIDGEMEMPERRRLLKAYDAGDVQVLTNVAVLTEGFDHQPTSCIVLLRPSSWKSTMVQMIGRGLRKVDPEKYPGVHKDDCIVLDFGTSVLMHGSLEDTVDLRGAGIKSCPECDATVPDNCYECPICGHEFPRITQESTEPGETTPTERGTLGRFVMSEIDILDRSPFKYEKFYDGAVQMCSAFTAWAAVCMGANGRFYSVGGTKDPETNKVVEVKLLADAAEHLIALQTADDFMRMNGDKQAASKTKRWLTEAPSDGQMRILNSEIQASGPAAMFGLTKYRAACMIELKFNMAKIGQRVTQAQQATAH